MTNLQKLSKAGELANQYLKIDFSVFIERYGKAFLDNPDPFMSEFGDGGYWGSFTYRLNESISMIAEGDRRADSDYEDGLRYLSGSVRF